MLIVYAPVPFIDPNATFNSAKKPYLNSFYTYFNFELTTIKNCKIII